jgi:hypothetical protein
MDDPSAALREQRTEELATAFRSLGASGVLSWIAAQDAEEHLKLYSLAQQTIFEREGSTMDLDGYIAVVDAGVADALRRRAAASDAEEIARYTQAANVLSYNMLADLADCWVGDDTPRQRRHFEAGLAAAQNCIRWREELNKPPFNRSIAWWGAGIHQLGLGQPEEAHASFSKALEYAGEAALADGRTTEITPDAPFLVLLSQGYVALSEMLLPMATGRARYVQVMDAFRAQLASEDSEVAEEAEIGIAQLEKSYAKYIRRHQDEQKR